MSGGLLVEREGDLLWATLDDPRRANALSPRLAADITELFSRDLRGEGVRAVLLRGAGKHFSAGADLAHLESLASASPDEHREDSERLRRLFESILRQPALTVALVQGACVAGGCGLATACDFVLAEPGAKFMYSEVRIGFVAALVATYLPLRVKGSDLRQLLLDPDFVSATEAQRLGLVNHLVEPGGDEDVAVALERAGRALAGRILEKASSESIARTKGLILEALGRPIGAALDRAVQVNAASRATPDCQHGIRYFLEHKKAPSWR